jgi:hypothetical protein
VSYSLSLRERVGVRDSQNQAIAGVSLLLASSLREEEQGKSRFFRLFQRLLYKQNDLSLLPRKSLIRIPTHDDV